jgi:flagellar assembly protein FliH
MSSNAALDSMLEIPVIPLVYKELSRKGGHHAAGIGTAPETEKAPVRIGPSDEEIAERVRLAREETSRNAEQRLRQEYEAKLQVARSSVSSAVADFQAEQAQYFAHVESEVVQLALSIAAKILHREAQVDPLLVAALVRIAIDKMSHASSVIIRVGEGLAASWKDAFPANPDGVTVDIVEDQSLSSNDVIVETELGTANFGLDAQLKEVERGFCDLLALRPCK